MKEIKKLIIKNKDFVIELPPCRKYIFILDKHVTSKQNKAFADAIANEQNVLVSTFPLKHIICIGKKGRI